MTIHHVEAGFGTSIVFLHGLGADNTQFEPQLKAFGPRFRTIAVDLRGNGASPELDVAPSDVLRAQANDVALLLDRLQVRRAHLVGVEYGGLVAQQFAIDHRDRVRTLTLSDTFCDTTGRSVAEKVMHLSQRLNPLVYKLPKQALAMAAVQQYSRWPQVLKKATEWAMAARSEELELQSKVLSKVNFTAALRRLDVPALGLSGDATPYARLMMADVCRALDAEHRMISNSMNLSNLCNSEEFNSSLKNFLDSVESDLD